MSLESLFRTNMFYFLKCCEHRECITPFLSKYIIKALTDSYIWYRFAEQYRYIEYDKARYSTEPIVVIVKNEVMA
jgi:hypothetical protein